MNLTLPETVDPWRMVAARRCFEGVLPLSALDRLALSLTDTKGEVRYSLEFGTDEFGVRFLQLDISTVLPLMCQRSLERFLLPIQVHQRMGLIRREEDESGMPPGYEALLVSPGGMHLVEVIEDELIMVVPLVPTNPEIEPVNLIEFDDDDLELEEERSNPFASLANYVTKAGTKAEKKK